MEGSGSLSIFPFGIAYCGGFSYLILGDRKLRIPERSL